LINFTTNGMPSATVLVKAMQKNAASLPKRNNRIEFS
jgi:hypothetical protein